MAGPFNYNNPEGTSGWGAGLSEMGRALMAFLMQQQGMKQHQKEFDIGQGNELARIEAEKQRVKAEQDRVALERSGQEYTQNRNQALDLMSQVGPMGDLDEGGQAIIRKGGFGSRLGGNLPSTDLKPVVASGEVQAQPPAMKGQNEVPQLNPMDRGEQKTPSSFYLRPNFLEDQQMQEAGRKSRDDEARQRFLNGLSPEDKQRATFGFQPGEPSWSAKTATEHGNKLEEIAAEGRQRMAAARLALEDKKMSPVEQLGVVANFMKIAEPDKLIDPDGWAAWRQQMMRVGEAFNQVMKNPDGKHHINLDGIFNLKIPGDTSGSIDPATGLPRIKPSASTGPGFVSRIGSAIGGAANDVRAAGQGSNQAMTDWLSGVLGKVPGAMDSFLKNEPPPVQGGCRDSAGRTVPCRQE